jgi:hypothetical protein
MLSLANQLAFSPRRVRLNFEDAVHGKMGSLNRMGFFDHLHHDVEVLPARPACSAAVIYPGGNNMRSKIARINKDAREKNLPTRLTEAITRVCQLPGR